MEFNAFLEIHSAMFEIKKKGSQPAPSKPAIKLYFELVRHLDIDAFKKAAFDVMQRSKWMPDPAEILQKVKGDTAVYPPHADEVFQIMYGDDWRQITGIKTQSDERFLLG